MSAEIDAITTRITEMVTCQEVSQQGGNLPEWLRFQNRASDLTLVKAALVDIDNRLTALEP